MSLVGPRLEALWLVERYGETELFRLEMRPGITGPMQVHGRGELTFQERLAVEREYVENYSLRKDIKILMRTVSAVARARGALERADSPERGPRRGNDVRLPTCRAPPSIAELRRRRPPLASLMRSASTSDTGRAAGLAVAVIAVNVVAGLHRRVRPRARGLRVGSLAALISAFIILMVPGSALQIATARDVSHAIADGDPAPRRRVRRWLRQIRDPDRGRRRDRGPVASLLGAAINCGPALGRGSRAAHGDAVDVRVCRARRPPGVPALQADRPQHGRGGARPARLRARSLWRRGGA